MRIDAALLLAAVLAAPSSEAQPPAPGVATEGWRTYLLSTPRLLGDPCGLRSRLEGWGISVQLFSNHTGSVKLRGGVDEEGDAGHSASADLFVMSDLEELSGWRGGTLLLHTKTQYDRSVNDTVGARSDPIDDADFDAALYVSELWLQQDLLGDRLRVRAGFQEQQTVFDRNEFANSEDRQFLAAALDNDPLVPLTNGLAVNLITRLAPWLELAAGTADADNEPRSAGFDTAFDDTRSLSYWVEATVLTRLPGPRGELPGAWRIGVFRDGRELSVLGERDPVTGQPRQRRGHDGAYLSVDQLLWRGPEHRGASLGAFARAGIADDDVAAYPVFWSAGLHAKGLAPGRPNDVVGLGAYQQRPSSRFRRSVPHAEPETGFEAYYAARVLPWLVLTPDLQVLLEPSGRSTRSAVLANLRVRLTW